MSSFIDNIKSRCEKADTLIRLIYINAGVFLLINILLIGFKLFNVHTEAVLNYLAAPSQLSELGSRFWTPITYMFVHKGFLHLLFNMLLLYWFGKIFLMLYSEKQLLGLYLFAGIIGALVFVAGYNFFPYFQERMLNSTLIGASAAVMGIVLAAALKSPNMELNLLFIGRVKIIYIAIISILISLFGVTGDNGGGELSHIGGALGGYLFFLMEKKGYDVTNFFNKIFDFFATVFRPRQRQNMKTYHSQKMSDADYNARKAENEEAINLILDKIKKSGYESLTTEEKKRLFDQKR